MISGHREKTAAFLSGGIENETKNFSVFFSHYHRSQSRQEEFARGVYNKSLCFHVECLSFRHHPKATTYFIPVSRKTQAVNTLFALSRHHCTKAVKADINYTTSCDDNQEKKLD